MDPSKPGKSLSGLEVSRGHEPQAFEKHMSQPTVQHMTYLLDLWTVLQISSLIPKGGKYFSTLSYIQLRAVTARSGNDGLRAKSNSPSLLVRPQARNVFFKYIFKQLFFKNS